MGTMIYAQNALLWQIVSLNTYFVEGLGFGTETLVGNFKGKGNSQQFAPVLVVSLLIASLIGLFFGGMCVLFPETVFGLFTNHTEVTSNINTFILWLLFVLLLSSIDFTLEGYFLGLGQGHILRNVSLIALTVGFLPTDFVSIKFASNHILWLSLSLFYAIRIVIFGLNLPKTFGSYMEDDGASLPALEDVLKRVSSIN